MTQIGAAVVISREERTNISAILRERLHLWWLIDRELYQHGYRRSSLRDYELIERENPDGSLTLKILGVM